MPETAESPLCPTDTFTVVGRAPAAPSRVAVTSTLAAPPFSRAAAGLSDSDTPVEAWSSSFRVRVASATVRTPEVPWTVMSSGPSATASSSGVRVKLALPEVCPARMVTVKSATAWKSVPEAAESPLRPTLTFTPVG